MVPMKSHNDFSRPLVEKGVVIEEEPILEGENRPTTMRAHTTGFVTAEL